MGPLVISATYFANLWKKKLDNFVVVVVVVVYRIISMARCLNTDPWHAESANEQIDFKFLHSHKIQSILFWSKDEKFNGSKRSLHPDMVGLVYISMNFGSYRSFFWSQYRMWNVFRERASHRIVYRVVLFVCFFPKTWRKLMVLCNISLTCWIIYSPRSMLARSRTHTWMMWWKKSKMNVRAAYHNRSYHRTPNKLWWVFSLFAQHHQSFGFEANSFSSFFASQLINNEKVFFEVLLFHWNISIEIWHLFDINSILKGIFFLYHPP